MKELMDGYIMTNKIFNTPYETALRLLLLLGIRPGGLTAETIYMADFLATYGKDYGISPSDLHGDNDLKCLELPARRNLCTGAVQMLSHMELAHVCYTRDGIFYRLTEKGQHARRQLQGAYASQYQDNAEKALSHFFPEKDIQGRPDPLYRIHQPSHFPKE